MTVKLLTTFRNIVSVQAWKKYQVDRAAAFTAEMSGKVFSYFILNPPFFARQFVKSHLLHDHRNRLYNFSTPLPVSLPNLNVSFSNILRQIIMDFPLKNKKLECNIPDVMIG